MTKQDTKRFTRVPGNFQGFLAGDYASGSLLLLATLVAILVANGPFSDPYRHFLERSLLLRIGPFALKETVREWINATLMALFFLSVGLEIKREIVLGSLNSLRKAALPVAGAIGGMLVPAFIYAWMNWNQPSVVGWAIPMATDPAFAIAILSVLRTRIPMGLRAFLISLAVVDDIGAIIVIALVYHEGFLLTPILISLAIVILLLLINRAGVQSLLPYLILGVFLWFAILGSGIHTSIAGVILALTIPVTSQAKELDAPLTRLEHMLAPWVNYLILPVFALSNAAISFQGISLSSILLTPVVTGLFLGLLLGKPLGIVFVSFMAVLFRAAHLPDGVRWEHLIGAGFLGGIGFTTSIFLANLAFAGDLRFGYSKIGILSASMIAAILGWLILMKIPSTEHE